MHVGAIVKLYSHNDVTEFGGRPDHRAAGSWQRYGQAGSPPALNVHPPRERTHIRRDSTWSAGTCVRTSASSYPKSVSGTCVRIHTPVNVHPKGKQAVSRHMRTHARERERTTERSRARSFDKLQGTPGSAGTARLENHHQVNVLPSKPFQ
jgi:hypothetical protein